MDGNTPIEGVTEESVARAVDRHINGQLVRTHSAITRGTYVTIGSAAAIILAVIAASYQAGTVKTGVEKDISSLQTENAKIADAVKDLASSVSSLAVAQAVHLETGSHAGASKDIERNRLKVQQNEERLRTLERRP